jgi:hypothetical protein
MQIGATPDEEFPWVVACHGTFLTVIPTPEFDDEEAPRRPPRAASAPAGSRRSAPRDDMEEVYSENFLKRLQLFHQSIPQIKRIDSQNGDSTDNQGMESPTTKTCELTKLASNRSSTCDVTKMVSNRSMMSASTMCPDEDVQSDDLMKKRSTKPLMTTFRSSLTMCPDEDGSSDDMTSIHSDGVDRFYPQSTATATALLPQSTATASTDSPTRSPMSGLMMCPDEEVGSYDLRRDASTESPPTSMMMCPDGEGKTMMLRHIPCRIDHEELVKIIHEQGFGGRFDFVYVPLSHRPKTNIGYAFVNLIDDADEEAFKRAFEGLRFPGSRSEKVCVVQPAHLQGRNAQLSKRRRKARQPRAGQSS